MLEEATGRLVGGVLWGLGAGLLLTVAGAGGGGLRSLTKGAMKIYLTAADRVQETAAEMRENVDDLTAEVRAERAAAGEPDTTQG